MNSIKYLIAVRKARDVQITREREIFNFAMLLVYLIAAYSFLNWLPEQFTYPSTLANMASVAIVIIGLCLAVAFDNLSNTIITK